MLLSEKRDILPEPPRPLTLEELIELHGLGPNPIHTEEDFYQSAAMSSAFVNTHRETSQTTVPVSIHSHDFYELIYCRSAHNVEYLLEDSRFRIQRGDMLYIPPGIRHCPVLPEHMEVPYVRDVIWINAHLLDSISLELLPRDEEHPDKIGLIRLEGIACASIGGLFRMGVLEAEAKEPCWEAAVVANTLYILAQLRRANISQQPRRAERADLLEQILAYVELHWSEKITISDVARHFFISESTITQTFRKKMDISFYRYVTQRRLTAAKELIDQSLPLEAVAEQTGFSDYSAFFRAFKSEYGISPGQYRKGFTGKP